MASAWSLWISIPIDLARPSPPVNCFADHRVSSLAVYFCGLLPSTAEHVGEATTVSPRYYALITITAMNRLTDSLLQNGDSPAHVALDLDPTPLMTTCDTSVT
jgi:hypothetical protein